MSSACLLSEMCVGYDSRSRIPAMTYGYNLCPGCLARCSGEVYALVFDYIDLSQVIARQQGYSDDKIARPKPESVPPIDMHVNTLRTEISVALASAEVVIRFALRMQQRPTAGVREGHNVQRSASFVAAHVERFAGLPLPPWFDLDGGWEPSNIGADALLMLRRLHERARRQLGTAELTIGLPGYCEKCRSPTLRRRSGSETVHCLACHDAQPWDQYRKRVTLAVTGVDVAQGDNNH